MNWPVRVGAGRWGRGVFATADVRKGEIVEVCPTLDVESKDVSGRMDDYVFSSNAGEGISRLILGYGMLYNHADEPDIEHVEHGEDEVAMIALRDIREGQEIMLSYGREWWDSREQRPDA